MAAPWRTLGEIRELPPSEGAVLMALAATGLAMANGRLAQTLARAGCFPEAREWAANPRKVQDLLAQLRGRGLAEERQGFWRACPAGLEAAARLAQGRGLLKRLHQAGLASGDAAGLAPDGELRARAELRVAFLGEKPDRWLPLRERFSQSFPGAAGGRDPLAPLCSGPFEAPWFEELEPSARAYGCNALLGDALLGLAPEPAFQDWLEQGVRTPAAGALALPFTLHLLLQGRPVEARTWLDAQAPAARRHPAWLCLEGLAALAEGDPAQAAQRYAAALKTLALPGKTARLPALHGPFHVLALLGSREAPALRLAEERAAQLAPGVQASVLQHLVQVLAGAPPEGDLQSRLPARRLPLDGALAALASHLAGEAPPAAVLERAMAACATLPLAWFAGELQELLRRQRGEAPRPSPLLDRMPTKAPWERSLDQLARVGAPLPEVSASRTGGKPMLFR